ncbi:hypothetical protein KR49_03970 [Synechococcus sp. KORDI-49]|nr:hypothetical protein KR49_03970 [Synechococcus sp. KORDI-49]
MSTETSSTQRPEPRPPCSTNLKWRRPSRGWRLVHAKAGFHVTEML